MLRLQYAGPGDSRVNLFSNHRYHMEYSMRYKILNNLNFELCQILAELHYYRLHLFLLESNWQCLEQKQNFMPN